jgi:glycosyltransferase involved in cell wall biosynthesis/ribosomal protein S18 acetylase RimI-like enzyme
MKIAHLTTVDLSLRYLVFPQLTATRDLGWDTAGISAPGPWVTDLEDAGIRHIPLASSTRGMNLLADMRATRELWRILREERFDILHTHNPKPGLYGRILGRIAGVPIVVNTVHGLYAAPDDPRAKRALVYFLEAIASRFSDAELVQSNEDVETMKRLRLAPHDHVWHLGNGVDLDTFTPDTLDADQRRALRAEFGANDDAIVVGAVGRLVAEKGYPELFEAAAGLGEEYVVVCIGPDDRDKSDALPSEMIEEASRNGIRFLGMRTDVDELYGSMDVFILPSHREGFPRSAMEAAASGLPVIATDIRGCRDVVDDGVNGYLIPVRDPGAIAATIIRLGSDERLRGTMGTAGRARAREHFDESRVVRRVVSSYKRVARRKGIDLRQSIDASQVTIRDAVRSDAETLARLHSSGINTGFLPSLGHRFMTVLYRALIDDDNSVVIVAHDDAGPVGFVAGAVDTRQFYRKFLKRYGIAAGVAAAPYATRRGVLRRAWESLTYEGAGTEGAELLATALLPAARSQGLGTRLGHEFLTAMAAKGARRVDVVVADGNAHAIAAYEKMGFFASDTIEVHAGERSVVLEWSE